MNFTEIPSRQTQKVLQDSKPKFQVINLQIFFEGNTPFQICCNSSTGNSTNVNISKCDSGQTQSNIGEKITMDYQQQQQQQQQQQYPNQFQSIDLGLQANGNMVPTMRIPQLAELGSHTHIKEKKCSIDNPHREFQFNQNKNIPSVPICYNSSTGMPIRVGEFGPALIEEQPNVFKPGMNQNTFINPQFGGLQSMSAYLIDSMFTMPNNYSSYKTNDSIALSSKELGACEAEKAINTKDIRKFKIKELNKEYHEFQNRYEFVWIENTKGELYLAINIAEYSNLRGEELKLFNLTCDEYLTMHSNCEKSIKHERLKYQKRVSKKNNKHKWASCARSYNMQRAH